MVRVWMLFRAENAMLTKDVNLAAARGVAVREFQMKSGRGEADYLLFVDGAPIGVIEAKRKDVALTGVEPQTTKYNKGIPDNLTRRDGLCRFSIRAPGSKRALRSCWSPMPAAGRSSPFTGQKLWING